MLTTKRFAKLIHPFAERAADVQRFMNAFKPSLEINVRRRSAADAAAHTARQPVELHDVVGPAGTDTALSAIVASPETLRGADTVNQLRAEHGLSALAVVPIDFVDGCGWWWRSASRTVG
jgi:phosphopantetheine adenylyltransferase